MTREPWSREEFLARLREVGAKSYHDRHPFHIRMNAGELSKDEIQLWVANRFYYQKNIPLKDAAILANCPLREVRQEWIKRIVNHDGTSTRRLSASTRNGTPKFKTSFTGGWTEL